MTVAELFGLGPVEPLRVIAAHRWGLFLLALVWALTAARGHRRFGLGLGCAWAFVAVGFWALALGRPLGYGLDAEATRSVSQALVAAETGRPEEGVASGVGVEPTLSARAATRLGAEVPIGLAALAPALVTPLLALALVACGRGDRASVAAVLVVGAATGDLDALRGIGLASGTAYRPEAAVALPVALGAALLAGRLARAGVALAAALAAVALVVVAQGLGLPSPAAPPAVPLQELPLAFTLDHAAWLALAVLRVAQWRGGLGGVPCAEDRAGAGFALTGFGLALAGAAAVGPLAADPWPGFVAWRLGLLLLASAAVLPLATAVAAGLEAPWTRRVARRREDLAVALVILVIAPGSFLAWWEPHRLDPLVLESFEPLSPRASAAADWLRRNTPADAVVLAAPAYLPEVLLCGRRRVLHAPGLASALDGERRLRAERAALTGRDAAPLFARYGLRYVFVGPGDFRAHGIAHAADLDGRPGLALRHVAAGGFRVYELVAGGSAGGG